MNETVRIKTKRLSRREIDDKYGIEPYLEDEAILADTVGDGRARAGVHVLNQARVVLGKGSDPEVELALSTCLGDGVPIQRRRGGGCAVLLDPGCVLVTAALRVPGIGQNKAHFDRLTDWMVSALDNIGYSNIKGDGISDLVLEDRKVAGTCLYRRKGLLLYSASLLVDPDLGAMERYLSHPPREPDYRRGRGHREFCVGLAEGVGQDGAARIAEQLRRALPEPAL